MNRNDPYGNVTGGRSAPDSANFLKIPNIYPCTSNMCLFTNFNYSVYHNYTMNMRCV